MTATVYALNDLALWEVRPRDTADARVPVVCPVSLDAGEAAQPFVSVLYVHVK